MPTDGWFRKKSKITQAPDVQNAATVPDGVATKCARCSQMLFTMDLEKNLKVCPHCDFHHKLTAKERIEYTVDAGAFKPLFDDLRSIDPLHFPEYQAKLDKGIATTHQYDGTVIGEARIGGVPVIMGVADFGFMGASMGSVSGEKVTRAMEEGIKRGCPVVLFTASGGARMQEGLLSLMQMAKTSAAAAKLAAAHLPYVVVMTDATMAGVLASYASLGDITLAEPQATIGFAGARVAAQASVQKPPADYQTAEWQLTCGQIDQIVHRRDMPTKLATLLNLLGFDSVPVVEGEAVEATQSVDGRNGHHREPALSPG